MLGLEDHYYIDLGGEGGSTGVASGGAAVSGTAGSVDTSGASGASGASSAAGMAGSSEGGNAGADSAFSMPNGKLVFERYTTYDTGDSEMFLVTFPGGAISEPLGKTYGLCALYNGIFSPDGRHLVVGAVPNSVCPAGALDRNELEVYILDLDNPGLLGKQRITDNNVPDEDPQYAPDGKSLLFKHGGYLARWVAGGTPFAETCADPTGSFCFTHSGNTFQSKPVIDDQGYVCYESSLSQSDPNGDILCFDLAVGLAGKDITLADNVTIAVDHDLIYDSRPVIASPWLYFTRWIGSSNRVNQIWRKPFKAANPAESRAAFCVGQGVGYENPFGLGEGDLLLFSSNESSLGKSDLFIADFTEAMSTSLNEFAPGVNTQKDELGASFWRAPPPP